jgi:hypothetical protein
MNTNQKVFSIIVIAVIVFGTIAFVATVLQSYYESHSAVVMDMDTNTNVNLAFVQD